MKNKYMPPTQGHFKSFGGETLTRLWEGAVVGAFFGFCIGIIVCMMMSSGALKLPGIEGLSSVPVIFLMVIICSVLFGASAGASVGIGVPKMNLRPQQGLIKKWKTVIVRDEKKDEVVYIPEETRKDRENH